MKLTYRGVSYNYTPNSIPVTPINGYIGKYRGVPTQFNPWADVPDQPSVYLTWRGVSYCPGAPAPLTAPTTPGSLVPAMKPAVSDDEPNGSARSNVESPCVPATETTSQIAEMARSLFMRHHRYIRKREQGMMVRLAAEVGLPVDQVAHYESHVQGKVPHDFAGYDRSLTAMS